MLKEQKVFALRILEGYKKALAERRKKQLAEGKTGDAMDTAYEIAYCAEVQETIFRI